MKFMIAITCAALGTTTLVGCVPKRVAWSPNGEYAAVVHDSRLYLCDGGGNLSAGFLDKVDSECLTPVVWFPDSDQMLVVRTRLVRTWEDLTHLLDEQRRQKLMTHAQELRREILAYDGDWNCFRPRSERGLTPGEVLAVRLILREKHVEEITRVVGKDSDLVRCGEIPVWSIQVLLYPQRRGSLLAHDSLVESIDRIAVVRLSPDGKHLAYVAAVAMSQEPRNLFSEDVLKQDLEWGLFVASTEGVKAPRMAARHVALYPDWSTDGRYLAYIQSNISFGCESSHPAMRLGAVARQEVCSQDGFLLEEFRCQEELATVLFSQWWKTYCLGDGSIASSALEMHLPANSPDMPQGVSLFSVTPGPQPVVKRLLPCSVEAQLSREGLLLGVFEMSPDRTRIAVAGQKGEVATIDLSDGEVSIVNGGHENPGDFRQMYMLPTWRSDKELCFEVLAGSPLEREGYKGVVLWSPGGSRRISGKWPFP